MSRPRCFAEFPAGLASVSLRLHGGPGCRPPISRMGNKAGYAETILWTLGLTAGKSAGAYCWAEADDDVRALLRAYPDPALLLQIAEIIRGWADEEPRALWERLRAERKARIAVGAPCEVAGFVHASGLSYVQGVGDVTGFVAPGQRRQDVSAWANADRCDTLANFAMLASSNRLINVAGPELMNTGKGGTCFGGDFATPAGDVAGAFEVAGWTFLGATGFIGGDPDSAYAGDPGDGPGFSGRAGDPRERIAGRLDGVPSSWPPVAVLPRIPSAADLATWLGTPGDLDGVVVYMDPPYLDTTGYLHDLGRADVVRHALDFASMGAHVAISEAVALPELTALGWHVADITGGRKGQKRTFSKQQGEYLTTNREPAYVVPTQAGLFACAS